MQSPHTSYTSVMNEPGRGYGSVTGSSVQLVEVCDAGPQQRATADGRWGSSARSSPAMRPLPHPGASWADDSEASDTGGHWPQRPSFRQSSHAERRERKESWGGMEDDLPPSAMSVNDNQEDQPPDDMCFNPEVFVGDWKDNFHYIAVELSQRLWRRSGRIRLVARMYNEDDKEKKFSISQDRRSGDWICGNARLVILESTYERLIWETTEGKKSAWTRMAPDSTVYFEGNHEDWGYMDPNYVMADGQQMMFQMPDGTMVPGEMQYPQQDWKELNLPREDADADAAASHTEDSAAVGVGADAVPAPPPEVFFAAAPVVMAAPPPAAVACNEDDDKEARGIGVGVTTFNSAVTEYKPQSVSAADSLDATTPTTTPKASKTEPKGKKGTESLSVPDDAPELHVSQGRRLQWTLNQSWGALSKYPKDFCVASPMFGLPRSAPCMQIMFYPNGSRTSEAGSCTVSLIRGQGSAGLKFEIFVNGSSCGPQKCVGARYLGDYNKPFDDTQEKTNEKVVIVMKIIDILEQ